MSEEELHSNKLTKLLIYMIINRDREIPFQEIIDLFWEGNAKNPQNALKNLIYRLRNVLKVLGEEEFIITLSGAYCWNRDVVIETDYEYFENLALNIRREKNLLEKKKLCKEAIANYKHNISEKIGTESWILSKLVWYRSLFIDVVKELGMLYEQEEAWGKLELLCNEALSVDPLDEQIHYWIIESLWKQDKSDLAMEHYENISKIMYDSMGIHVSERLQSIFKDMKEYSKGKEKDFDSMISEVEESDHPQGAFFCDYQSFRQIYRMEARRNQRSGIKEQVILMTLRRNGGVKRITGVDSGLMEGMTFLEESLRKYLRKGDVVTRCSSNQYLLLLTSCNQKDGTSVAERVKKVFQKKIGNRHLELEYFLKTM